MRSEATVGVPGSYLHAAVHRVIENGRAKEVKRALRLRLIDKLTFSGATAVVERGENRHRAEPGRDVVGISAERSRGEVDPAIQ